MMLDTERQFYNTRRHKLREIYQGKFLVIVGKRIMGVYETHAEAYTNSRQAFEIGDFLICNTSVPHKI
jgi:hypothetical protein